MKNAIMRDDGNHRILYLPEGCLRHLLFAAVGGIVPPDIPPSSIYRRDRVLNIHLTSQSMLWRHIRHKVPSRTGNTKDATTRDDGNHRVLHFPTGCVRHLLPKWVNYFRWSVLIFFLFLEAL